MPTKLGRSAEARRGKTRSAGRTSAMRCRASWQELWAFGVLPLWSMAPAPAVEHDKLGGPVAQPMPDQPPLPSVVSGGTARKVSQERRSTLRIAGSECDKSRPADGRCVVVPEGSCHASIPFLNDGCRLGSWREALSGFVCNVVAPFSMSQSLHSRILSSLLLPLIPLLSVYSLSSTASHPPNNSPFQYLTHH